MNTLHKYLQTFNNELHQLLNDHQDDEKLIAAVEEKWLNENDVRRNFVIGCQTEAEPLGGRKGLHGLRDTGDDGDIRDTDEPRENEPVGINPKK